MALALKTKNGELSAYGFQCGYTEYHKGLTIWFTSGCYHVGGWPDNGTEHVRRSFGKLDTARFFVKNITN